MNLSGLKLQVLSNLLSNAIKFTKEGTIFIMAERKDKEIFVSVSDVGTGIHMEIIDLCIACIMLSAAIHYI